MNTTVKAIRCDYQLLAAKEGCTDSVYPLLRDWEGDEAMISISPEHGRSYIVGKTTGGRTIVSKGNGLSYSQFCFLNTGEYGDNTWGLLLKSDAIRDFHNGIIAKSLGVKTNNMQYIIELDRTITVDEPNHNYLKPVLLQYDVECPYRISDAPFMPKKMLKRLAEQWSANGLDCSVPRYLVAAEVLIGNLFILHSNGFLHNAISTQNYTWALELLDFELSNSNQFPLNDSGSQLLYNRETVFTYQIIDYIASVLGERINYVMVDAVFAKYGFNLHHFQCK